MFTKAHNVHLIDLSTRVSPLLQHVDSIYMSNLTGGTWLVMQTIQHIFTIALCLGRQLFDVVLGSVG